ncbi:unnamed protein product [Prorocentrum cordatum]|uniref:Uncharacterized protein n=1 Tax=Prorocentrum cordatum TaxID=2364126 RepID=A0ABN9SWW2_9DINO|nr:unnamed protein product [Polarella glacialis]
MYDETLGANSTGVAVTQRERVCEAAGGGSSCEWRTVITVNGTDDPPVVSCPAHSLFLEPVRWNVIEVPASSMSWNWNPFARGEDTSAHEASGDRNCTLSGRLGGCVDLDSGSIWCGAVPNLYMGYWANICQMVVFTVATDFRGLRHHGPARLAGAGRHLVRRAEQPRGRAGAPLHGGRPPRGVVPAARAALRRVRLPRRPAPGHGVLPRERRPGQHHQVRAQLARRSDDGLHEPQGGHQPWVLAGAGRALAARVRLDALDGARNCRRRLRRVGRPAAPAQDGHAVQGDLLDDERDLVGVGGLHCVPLRAARVPRVRVEACAGDKDHLEDHLAHERARRSSGEGRSELVGDPGLRGGGGSPEARAGARRGSTRPRPWTCSRRCGGACSARTRTRRRAPPASGRPWRGRSSSSRGRCGGPSAAAPSASPWAGRAARPPRRTDAHELAEALREDASLLERRRAAALAAACGASPPPAPGGIPIARLPLPARVLGRRRGRPREADGGRRAAGGPGAGAGRAQVERRQVLRAPPRFRASAASSVSGCPKKVIAIVRNTVPIFVCFLIGKYYMDHSFVMASTLSLLMTRAPGEVTDRNVQRLIGVALAGALPLCIVWLLTTCPLTQCGTGLRTACQGLSLWLFVSLFAYIGLSGTQWSYPASLIAGLGVVPLMKTCPNITGESALHQDEITREVVFALIVQMAVDTVLMWGRTPSISAETLFGGLAELLLQKYSRLSAGDPAAVSKESLAELERRLPEYRDLLKALDPKTGLLPREGAAFHFRCHELAAECISSLLFSLKLINMAVSDRESDDTDVAAHDPVHADWLVGVLAAPEPQAALHDTLTFMRARISAIRRTTRTHDWHHCREVSAELERAAPDAGALLQMFRNLEELGHAAGTADDRCHDRRCRLAIVAWSEPQQGLPADAGPPSRLLVAGQDPLFRAGCVAPEAARLLSDSQGSEAGLAGERRSILSVMRRLCRWHLAAGFATSVAHGALTAGVKPLVLRAVIDGARAGELSLGHVALLTAVLVAEAMLNMWNKQLLCDDVGVLMMAAVPSLLSRRGSRGSPRAPGARAPRPRSRRGAGRPRRRRRPGASPPPSRRRRSSATTWCATWIISPILWVSCVTQLLCGVAVLLWIAGPAALAGVGVLCFSVAVASYTSSINKKYDKRGLEAADERIALLSQVLDGVRFVKLSAWEEAYMERSLAIRVRETGQQAIWRTLQMFGATVGRCTPPVASMATFMVMLALGELVAVSSSAVSVFMTLRLPMGIIPAAMMMWNSLKISMQRVDEALGRPAVEPQPEPESPQAAASLRGVALAYGCAGGPVLSDDVTLDVVLGRSLGVFGAVASGKSTLLVALLGGMQPLRGSVRRCGLPAAYVPQHPVVFSGSILANIVMGRAYDEQALLAALTAARFVRDLELLPFGIMTEIGERGTTLSGGQQARLNVARAFYHQPSVLVADDPLAAVDVHVAGEMFEAMQQWRRASGKRALVLATNHCTCCRASTTSPTSRTGACARRAPTRPSSPRRARARASRSSWPARAWRRRTPRRPRAPRARAASARRRRPCAAGRRGR